MAASKLISNRRRELHWLKARPAAPAQAVERTPGESPVEDLGKIVACARCESYVTTSAARIAMDGRHEHRFVNPHGLLFRIGCFSAAAGCLPVGEISTFWSWFPGFAWQVDLCGSCGEHLGWLFSNPSNTFHGLIIEKIIELDEDG
ncbi:MAG: hypothetical protein HYX75_19130 [Acidobacteria bacterium]|nr:hypothetical protein [Acidobacteriota bacterium]